MDATSAADLAACLVGRLEAEAAELRETFGPPEDTRRVRACWLDDVFPSDLSASIVADLPPLSDMVRRQNWMERKYVMADMARLSQPVQALVRSFSTDTVAQTIGEVLGKPSLETDARFYNGGLTAMLPHDFMCPHLDNSHDYSWGRRRELVLLYYFTPGWQPAYGGHLEAWDDHLRGEPRRIDFKTNRLVIMETTEWSWHSIRPVLGPLPRLNTTTYLYAPASARSVPRLTRFAAWPGQPARQACFDAVFHLRSLAARIGGERLRRNAHMNPHVDPYVDPGMDRTSAERGPAGLAGRN